MEFLATGGATDQRFDERVPILFASRAMTCTRNAKKCLHLKKYALNTFVRPQEHTQW